MQTTSKVIPNLFDRRNEILIRQDNRSEEAQRYRVKYKSKRWQELRAWHLRQEPLCRFCMDFDGIATGAEVVDHIKPHRGNDKLFWDSKNLQSLCKKCHDGRKQQMEKNEDRPTIGIDGWPIE